MLKPGIIANLGVTALTSPIESIGASDLLSTNSIGLEIHEIYYKSLLLRITKLLAFQVRVAGLLVSNVEVIETAASFLLSNSC